MELSSATSETKQSSNVILFSVVLRLVAVTNSREMSCFVKILKCEQRYVESNQSNATICGVRDLVLGGVATRNAWNSVMESYGQEENGITASRIWT